MVIRPEAPNDLDRIDEVVTAAFGSAAEAELVRRIRASPEFVPEMALVAEDEGEVVGHVMISGAVLRHDDGERRIVMLSPLAVVPERQRQGIGGELIRAVVALADQRGEPLVVLEGSPDYYPRFGFQPASPHGITVPIPDWAPPDAAQVTLLAAYDPADPTLRGHVVYPPSFDGLDDPD